MVSGYPITPCLRPTNRQVDEIYSVVSGVSRLIDPTTGNGSVNRVVEPVSSTQEQSGVAEPLLAFAACYSFPRRSFLSAP
jgi:hypothetical protein